MMVVRQMTGRSVLARRQRDPSRVIRFCHLVEFLLDQAMTFRSSNVG